MEEGGYTPKTHVESQAQSRQCERSEAGEVTRIHLHLVQQAPGGPGLRHVSLEGGVGPAGRPRLAPRPAQQPHRLACRCPIQVASGHGGPLSGQAHTDRPADAATRTCGGREREGVGSGQRSEVHRALVQFRPGA